MCFFVLCNQVPTIGSGEALVLQQTKKSRSKDSKDFRKLKIAAGPAKSAPPNPGACAHSEGFEQIFSSSCFSLLNKIEHRTRLHHKDTDISNISLAFHRHASHSHIPKP